MYMVILYNMSNKKFEPLSIILYFNKYLYIEDHILFEQILVFLEIYIMRAYVSKEAPNKGHKFQSLVIWVHGLT